jgi:hypothetical protein
MPNTPGKRRSTAFGNPLYFPNRSAHEARQADSRITRAREHRVGGRFPPLQPERIAQPSEESIGEAVDDTDCPVGIGASEDRRDCQ